MGAESTRVRRENLETFLWSLASEDVPDQWDLPARQEREGPVGIKEDPDSEDLQVTMASLVYRVSLVNRDLRVTRLTRGVWERRWLTGLTERWDPKAC